MKEYVKFFLDIDISKSFIRKLLLTEPCLIIYDGLEELPSLNDTKQSIILPLGTTSKNSIFLTMCRPWKLNYFKQHDPLPDQIFEIHGVNAESQINKMFSLSQESDEQRDKFRESYEKYHSFQIGRLR